MNERYLYRGKRKDNGEWVTGYLIQGNNTYIVTPEAIYYMVVSISYVASVEFVEVIPETVGQCTGLKDKNGNWIFEGDMVKNKAWYVIKYENGGCGLSGFGKTKPIPIMGHWNFNSDKIEVISNIHDNPELLEVSE